MIQECKENEEKPENQVAVKDANLVLREALAKKLAEHFAELGLSQTESSAILGISQPRTSSLLNGKIEFFSLDSLVKMLYLVGYKLDVKIIKS